MASTVVSNTETYAGWHRQQCTQDNVNQLVKRKFINIIHDSNRWRAEYKNNTKILDHGFWYPNEYLFALKEKGQHSRFEFLKNKSAAYHGFPPKSFTHVADETGQFVTNKRPCAYVLNNGLASEAIKNIRESQFFFIDCQEAIQIAEYEALLEILGDKKFDALFSPNGKTPLSFDPHSNRTPLKDFLAQKQRSADDGEEAMFLNIRAYTVKHPLGEAGGYHALAFRLLQEKNFLPLDYLLRE